MGRRSHRRPGVRGVYFHRIPFSVYFGGGLEVDELSLVRIVGLMGGRGLETDWWTAVAAVA
jgi:hypothetical protein